MATHLPKTRIEKPRKSGIPIYLAAAMALSSKTDRTATFEEIGAIIEKNGILPGRTSTYSIAEELALKINASTSKYKRWFIFTKPDTLTLADKFFE